MQVLSVLGLSMIPQAPNFRTIGQSTWRPRELSKWVISRVISTLNGVTLIITLLITDLVSPPGLQVP